MSTPARHPAPRPFFVGLLCALALLAGGLRPAQATLPAAVIEAPGLWLGLARAVPALVEGLAAGPCRAVGYAAFGRLENGVRAQSTPGLFVRSPDAWGTPETVSALRRVATEVESLYPGRGELVVTDISTRFGGHLRPHRTHQNGRDVDVLLYRDRPGEGARGPGDLDAERTYTLLALLRSAGTIDTVLMDRRLQYRVMAYARDALHRPADELAALFQVARGAEPKGALCQHAPGHRTHLHLRFKSPLAEAAARAYDAERGFERVVHTVLRGQTLTTIAELYGASPVSIAVENRLGPRTRLRGGQRLFVLRPLPQGNVRVGPRVPSDAQGG